MTLSLCGGILMPQPPVMAEVNDEAQVAQLLKDLTSLCFHKLVARISLPEFINIKIEIMSAKFVIRQFCIDHLLPTGQRLWWGERTRKFLFFLPKCCKCLGYLFI